MGGGVGRVCHLLGSLGSGGRESLLLDIVDHTPDGVDYTLCCFRGDDDAASAFERRGVDVRSFDVGSPRDVGGLVALFRHLRNADVDVLHVHGPRAQVPGRVLGRAAGIDAVVSTHHGVREMFPEPVLKLEAATRWLDSVTVAVSRGVRRSFDGAGARGWRTIPNGIDVDAFNAAVEAADPAPVADRHDLTDELVLLNVGRYVPPKAQHDLVAAMDAAVEELPPVHLFIVGGRGAMKGRLRDEVSRRGLDEQVTVTGYVEDIHAYYAAADAFVSSSTEEGLPIVLLEAMAAELPVVATDIPGVRELIEDGRSGILVPPERPEQLGRQLVAVADPETRRRLAERGHRRVAREFDIAGTAAAYVDVYREAAGEVTA